MDRRHLTGYAVGAAELLIPGAGGVESRHALLYFFLLGEGVWDAAATAEVGSVLPLMAPVRDAAAEEAARRVAAGTVHARWEGNATE